MLTIRTRDLIKPLGQVARVLTNNSPSNHVLLRSNANTLVISAGLDVKVQVKIPYDSDEHLAFAPEGKKLFSVLKSLPTDKDVTIETTDNVTQIKCGRSRFKLNSFNEWDLLPSLDIPDDDEPISFVVNEAGQLAQCIETVHCAASKEDVRYYLNGICFELEVDQVKLVATNGHIVGHIDPLTVEVDTPMEKAQMLVGHLALAEILNLAKLYANKPIKVTRYKKHPHFVFVECENTTIKANLIDGRYPEWRRVLTVSDDHERVNTDRQELLSAIQRVSILAPESQGVTLVFDQDRVTVSCQNAAGETAEESVAIDRSNDHEAKLSTNYNYLIDALKRIQDDHVELLLKDSTVNLFLNPVTPSDQAGHFTIAPMRI